MKGDEIERILDGALKSYASAEPRLGLEHRILNRVRDAGEVRKFGWLRWVAVVPVLACLLVIAITFWPKHDRDSQPANSKPPTAKVLPRSPIEPKAVQATIRKSTPRRFSLPKRAQFPTPIPLTEEERALLVFVDRGPAAQAVLAKNEEHMSEPLEIGEIHIKPLQDGGQ